MMNSTEAGKCRGNEERLKGIIESLKRFPLDVEEEKLKKEVFEKLIDKRLEHPYTRLEAEAVSYGCVLHKRKVDSFGVPVKSEK